MLTVRLSSEMCYFNLLGASMQHVYWLDPIILLVSLNLQQHTFFRYRLYGTDEKFWNYLPDEPATALGAVVTPLQPRTRYEVQIAAFTSKGTGSYVGASVETIESPGNVVFCIAKGSVFSEWKKLVKESKGNSKFSLFKKRFICFNKISLTL